jgi:hypothetical protein
MLDLIERLSPLTLSPSFGGALRDLRTSAAGSPRRCRLGYTALRMPTFRDYRATIECAHAGSGGTDIVWHATFRPQVPGTGRLLQGYLRRCMGKIVANLARRALTPGPGLRS